MFPTPKLGGFQVQLQQDQLKKLRAVGMPKMGRFHVGDCGGYVSGSSPFRVKVLSKEV